MKYAEFHDNLQEKVAISGAQLVPIGIPITFL